jgi:PIN domain nuclease of toxin-antitoxin system
MRLLLDTHTFIWWHSDPARLSQKVLALCLDRSNLILLSVVSAWEIQIKHQLGKLQMQTSLAEAIDSQQQTNQIEMLPITLEHVLMLDNLPGHHKDPFDRLLVAQAMVEKAILLSHDAQIASYPIKVEW